MQKTYIIIPWRCLTDKIKCYFIFYFSAKGIVQVHASSVVAAVKQSIYYYNFFYPCITTDTSEHIYKMVLLDSKDQIVHANVSWSDLYDVDRCWLICSSALIFCQAHMQNLLLKTGRERDENENCGYISKCTEVWLATCKLSVSLH